MPRCSAISSTDNQRSGVVDISIFGFCKVCSGCFTPMLAATIYSQLDTNSADIYQLGRESSRQENAIRNAPDPRAYFESPVGAVPVFLLTQPSGRCQLKAPQRLLVPPSRRKGVAVVTRLHRCPHLSRSRAGARRRPRSFRSRSHACAHGAEPSRERLSNATRRYWQLADSDDASSTAERLVNHCDLRQ
jgi:hypothetical protein